MMELYNLMLQDGVEPNAITWNALVSSSNKLNRPNLGLAFYEAMKKSDASLDTSTYSSIFSCYASLKDSSKLTRVWNEMLSRKVRPDSVVSSSYIWACLEGGDPENALQFFLQWRAEGTPPGWKDVEINKLVYFSEIQGEYAFLGKMTMHRKALRIQRWLRSIGVKPESLKLQDLEERSKTERDKVWVQAAKLARPFLPPKDSELSPTPAAYGYAILACKKLGQRTDLACNLANELANIKFSNSPVEFAAAIGACAAINSLDVALSILKKANASGVSLSHHSFTSALAICAEVEDVSSALWILREMKSSGIKPNAYTMNCVLSICATTGRVAGALKLFKSLEATFEVKPDLICFATMWEMLGKYERWQDALTFFLVAEKVLDSRSWPFLFLGGQRKNDEDVLPLNLHNLSTIGASVVLRGWILLLYNLRMNTTNSRKDSMFVVITGTGKSSHGGQSKLKPSVLRTLHSIFRNGDGAHFDESNPGQICIPVSFIDNMKMSDIERLGLGDRDQQETMLAFLYGHESPGMKDIETIK
jgi:pentatricopeptide repeat protein